MILTITSRAFLTLVSVAALVALPSYLAVEAQRQDNRELRIQEVKELPAKAKRYALVIGVDEYQDEQISRLSGATNDAKALADALVRYAGFPSDQVILLASDQPRVRGLLAVCCFALRRTSVRASHQRIAAPRFSI